MAEILFECPTCGARHTRGFLNGVDVFRCLRCGPTTDEEQKTQDAIRSREARARVPREHPEDRKMRLEGEVYGRKHADAFCSDQSATLVELIELYADADAHALLDDLRERFWAQEWQPSKRQGA